MIEDEVRRSSMIASGAYYNLDDEEQRDRLEGDGLIIKVEHEANFMVKENPSTGFSWVVDQSSCFIDGMVSYET